MKKTSIGELAGRYSHTRARSELVPQTLFVILLAKTIHAYIDVLGRGFDNIFFERLWRTVKFKKEYLSEFQSAKEAHAELKSYFQFYNRERLHQALPDRAPALVYAAAYARGFRQRGKEPSKREQWV